MNKKISVLVPAFNDLGFIKYLLKQFPTTNNNLELIILDDSNNSQIENYLKNTNNLFKFNYIKNTSNKGAVKTWNELLSLATGDFIWLLHQNDFPSNFRLILDIVSSTKSVDAFIIPTYVENKPFRAMTTVQKHTHKILLNQVLKNPRFLVEFNANRTPIITHIKRILSKV